MNWIRENKFLTGFIAVMVIGAGVLGYLLYTAWGAYTDVNEQFTAAASDLKQLETRVPYPTQDNLNKYRAERDDLIDSTHSLAENLSKMVLPVEELSPSAFQDRLRETVSAVTSKAAQGQIKLPDKFALDFDQYQSQPPSAAAAGVLGRQLTAINIVMNTLLDEHIESLVSITRTRLPQEGAAPAARPGAGNNKPGNAPAAAALVEKVPFEVRFVATQQTFQKVLNDIAASDKQFFITRTLLVENSDPKPVSKAVDTPGGGAPAGAAPGGAPATTGTDAFLKFLVGTEKTDVAMRVEMVTFNPPDKSARTGAAPAAAQPHH